MVRILNGPFKRALIVESPHETLDEHLAKIGIEATRLDKVPDEETLCKALRDSGAQILFKRSRVPVTRTLVESCPDLHAVQLCCIGDDSIDKAACSDHGLMVFNDPVSNGRSVVELVLTHLIALSRRLYETNHEIHKNEWNKNARDRYEIKGKKLGIIGLGKIGRQVARICEHLGLEVAFFDNRPVANEIGMEMGWESYADMGELFANSDLVTVHISARDCYGSDNTNLLDPYLEQMGTKRPDTSPRIFLNLARGNIYSSGALVKAVSSGAIKRAAVDVYPEEPAPGEKNWKNPYAEYPQIICTPHIGAATSEAQPRIAARVSKTIAQFSRYGSLRDCVYSPTYSLSVANEARGKTVLAVVHSTARGTKKAVTDAIYQAEANTLGSYQKDFEVGLAYDLSVLDRPLPEAEIKKIIELATSFTNNPRPIRAVRQINVPEKGW